MIRKLFLAATAPLVMAFAAMSAAYHQAQAQEASRPAPTPGKPRTRRYYVRQGAGGIDWRRTRHSVPEDGQTPYDVARIERAIAKRRRKGVIRITATLAREG